MNESACKFSMFVTIIAGLTLFITLIIYIADGINLTEGLEKNTCIVCGAAFPETVDVDEHFHYVEMYEVYVPCKVYNNLTYLGRVDARVGLKNLFQEFPNQACSIYTNGSKHIVWTNNLFEGNPKGFLVETIPSAIGYQQVMITSIALILLFGPVLVEDLVGCGCFSLIGGGFKGCCTSLTNICCTFELLGRNRGGYDSL